MHDVEVVAAMGAGVEAGHGEKSGKKEWVEMDERKWGFFVRKKMISLFNINVEILSVCSVCTSL